MRRTSILAAAVALALAAGCSDDPAPDFTWDGLADAPYDVTSDSLADPTDAPFDAPFTCTPGEWGCYGDVYYQCADDGTSRINETHCTDECVEDLGCVLCRPGSRRCEGNVSMLCAADGEAWVTGRDCDEWGSTCGADGYCADECGDAESTNSYVGCEYWPTPLTNTAELDSGLFDFRVVVGNPNDSEASVTVERGGSVVATEFVPAGGLTEIVLPWVDGQSFGIPRDDWNSIIVADGAYRLKSSLPVTVSQFNPFEYAAGGDFSYTNDATLLLPSHVLTGDYVGLTYVPFSRRSRQTGPFPIPPDYAKYADYIAVVGITPEPTEVQVEVRGNVAGESAGIFADTPAGGNVHFTLHRGQVAHIANLPPPNCDESRPGFNEEGDCTATICDYLAGCREVDFDLTGSRVTADQPVAVFGGHVCAYVPYYSQACDHLEVQLAPIQTWGQDFVSMPMVDEGTNYPNLVRVVAAFDGTTVTVDPPQDGVSTVMLDRYEWVEFFAHSAFHVTGSHSIMVGQYLLGQYYPDPHAERGDPAMTVLVPEEQYREDYTFVTPSSYNPGTNGQSYVMIVRPPGMMLTLDMATLSSVPWTPIGGWEIGIVAVEGGTHTIHGDEPFGMITFGMGSFTSYAYPAGLNLEQITVII
jgi:hypothetical protein